GEMAGSRRHPDDRPSLAAGHPGGHDRRRMLHTQERPDQVHVHGGADGLQVGVSQRAHMERSAGVGEEDVEPAGASGCDADGVHHLLFYGDVGDHIVCRPQRRQLVDRPLQPVLGAPADSDVGAVSPQSLRRSEADTASTPGDQRRQPLDPGPALGVRGHVRSLVSFRRRRRATDVRSNARRSCPTTRPAGRGRVTVSVREFNLADLFELVVDVVPDRAALAAGPVRLTYRELEERSNRFAHYLQKRGIEPGQFVGILARNRAEWVEAMIGCFKARVAPINLNYRYVAAELRYVGDNADLVALVYERALAPLVAESFANTSPPGVLIVIEDAVTESDGADDGLGAADYEAALSSSSPERDFDRRSPDDLYVLYTGGTTGMPKGVMWRHEDIFFAAMGGGGWGREPVVTADEMTDRVPTDDAGRMVILALAPLMHGNAQWGMWNGLVMGGTAVIYTEPSFDADKVLRLVDREGVLSVSLVGDAMGRPLAEALARKPDAYDTSSLVAVSSGGARFSDTVKAELKVQLPNVMIMD